MSAFASHVVQVPYEVDRELRALGLSRELVEEVAHRAAAARAEALPTHPVGFGGFNSYAQGTHAIRMRLLASGWKMRRDGNVEGTLSPDGKVLLVFQNVDRACAQRDPEAISGKGTASRKLVQAGQGLLFPESLSAVEEAAGATVWLLCVSADDYSVRAEVSCPKSFEGTQFDGFTTRLCVVDQTFEPGPVTGADDLDGDSGDDSFDVVISKK
jgi:hypothetical protein